MLFGWSWLPANFSPDNKSHPLQQDVELSSAPEAQNLPSLQQDVELNFAPQAQSADKQPF